MGESTISDILCIEGAHKHYAVEFQYVEEICGFAGVYPVPCLPESFSGMFSYKGNIIPVIRLEAKEPDEKDKKMIMVLKYEYYMAGAVIPPQTFITSMEQVKMVKSAPGMSENGIWKEKEICFSGGKLFSLLDVEETFKNLVLYP